MVESLSDFPFRKLRLDVYATLDVIMCVDYEDALTFMFNTNKETRRFLQKNFITLRNGFINEGLIIFRLGPS